MSKRRGGLANASSSNDGDTLSATGCPEALKFGQLALTVHKQHVAPPVRTICRHRERITSRNYFIRKCFKHI